MTLHTAAEHILGIDFGPRYRHQCRFCLRPLAFSAGMHVNGRPAHPECYEDWKRHDGEVYAAARLNDPRYVMESTIVEAVPSAAAQGALPWD